MKRPDLCSKEPPDLPVGEVEAFALDGRYDFGSPTNKKDTLRSSYILTSAKLAVDAAGRVPTILHDLRSYDTGLEVRTPDLTQIFPVAGILRLESQERGTIVHLTKSTPMFLPFGSAFRADFIDALREKTEQTRRASELTAPGGPGSS